VKWGGLKLKEPREPESPDCRNEIIASNRLKNRSGTAKNNTTALSSIINYMINAKSGFCKENYKLVITAGGDVIVGDKVEKIWTSQTDWETGTRSQVDTVNPDGDLKLYVPEPTPYTLATLPQSANVVGYWKFEEASGTLYDETANNNDGTYNGSLYQQAGRVGYGLGFEGSNVVNCGNDNSLQLTELTYSCWVYCNTLDDYYIMNKWTDGKEDYFIGIWTDLWGSTGRKFEGYVLFDDTTYGIVTSTTTPEAGKWYLIIMTYDNTNGTKLYINGVLEDTNATTKTVDTDNGNLYLGGLDETPSYTIDGTMEETIIWNTALTTSEVESLYQHYSNGYDRLQYDSGADKTDWSAYSFIASETPSVTNVKIRCKSASSQAGLSSATWGSWFDVGSGVLDCANNQWIEVEAYLETTDQLYTPTLNILVINGEKPIG